ncbi:MAG: peptidoglycan DD-metalloendopeptidase family protein [Candidatus Muiribacteriota bacterium]
MKRFKINFDIDFYLAAFFYALLVKFLVVSLIGINLQRVDYTVYYEGYSDINIKKMELLANNDIRIERNPSFVSLIGDDINKAVKFKFLENIPDGVEIIEYTVQSGDNIWDISRKFRITPSELLKVNNLNTDVIFRNQVIKIPVYSGRVQLPSHVINLLWPVNGWISSGYGPRIHPITRRNDFHDGVDIVADFDTPIRASETGIVIFAGYRQFAGNTVIIRHIDGVSTIYAHCSKILVTAGDYVAKGDYIARIGKTGLATGYHVHFAVKLYGTYVNPLLYLKQYIE